MKICKNIKTWWRRRQPKHNYFYSGEYLIRKGKYSIYGQFKATKYLDKQKAAKNEILEYVRRAYGIKDPNEQAVVILALNRL